MGPIRINSTARKIDEDLWSGINAGLAKNPQRENCLAFLRSKVDLTLEIAIALNNVFAVGQDNRSKKEALINYLLNNIVNQEALISFFILAEFIGCPESPFRNSSIANAILKKKCELADPKDQAKIICSSLNKAAEESSDIFKQKHPPIWQINAFETNARKILNPEKQSVEEALSGLSAMIIVGGIEKDNFTPLTTQVKSTFESAFTKNKNVKKTIDQEKEESAKACLKDIELISNTLKPQQESTLWFPFNWRRKKDYSDYSVKKISYKSETLKYLKEFMDAIRNKSDLTIHFYQKPQKHPVYQQIEFNENEIQNGLKKLVSQLYAACVCSGSRELKQRIEKQLSKSLDRESFLEATSVFDPTTPNEKYGKMFDAGFPSALGRKSISLPQSPHG